jgi:hypothetical protein
MVDPAATTSLHRVTIIAESVLEARLITLIQACGASGWTLTEARGAG